MMPFFILTLTVNIFIATFGTPILDGEDVGKVEKKGRKITGQTNFPYVVYIQISETKLGKTNHYNCVGVIIHTNAVLTSAHCIYDLIHPKISVHAGIVHLSHEKDVGQKIAIKDYLVHRYFRDECPVGKDRCCYGVNDLAILWTAKHFIPGPNVRVAALNTDLRKPVNKKGWIVGWGATNDNLNPPMLKKGAVQVLSQSECERFNPTFYITQAIVCLTPVSKKTRSMTGDSGGPFVRGGIVYGLSSSTIKKEPCFSKTVDLFTYVARYTEWIYENLADGPPKERAEKKLGTLN